MLRESACVDRDLQLIFSALLPIFNSLLIVRAEIALAKSASCKKCRTAEFIEACRVCIRRIGIPIVSRLLTTLPLQDSVVDQRERDQLTNGCLRYAGNWMAQTLGHMLTNWLLFTHGWLCLSSQALHGACPICFLNNYSWS